MKPRKSSNQLHKLLFSSSVCVCSVVSDFVTPWPVTCQAPLSMGIHSPDKNTGVGCHLLFNISSWLRDWTCVSCISCIGRWILYHWVTWEAHLYICRLRQLSQQGMRVGVEEATIWVFEVIHFLQTLFISKALMPPCLSRTLDKISCW